MAMEGRSEESTARPALAEWLEALLMSRRARVLCIAVAFALSLILGLGSVGLWGTRESRLAACVVDVVRHGNWLVPNLWGRPRLEKPPLPYWIISAAVQASGTLNEWTLRLPGLAAALLILAAVHHLAREAGGARSALLAVLFLLSSFYFVSELRQPSSDLFLSAFCSAALGAWWRGHASAEDRARWWPLAGLFTGLAIASKGPVALAVVLPPIAGYMAWNRELGLPRTRPALGAVLLALLVGLAWPTVVLAWEPQAWITWINQLDLKVSQGSFSSSQERAVWYYVLQWPQYLFPWSVLGIGAVRYGFLRRSAAVPNVVRFAWFWFFGDLVLFTVFDMRKIYYLMPAVPGLAVLVAHAALDTVRPRQGRVADLVRRWGMHAQLGLMAAAGIGISVTAWLNLDRFRWAGAAYGVVVAGVCLAIHLAHLRHGRVLVSFVAYALIWCLSLGLTYAIALPGMDADHSHRQFMARATGRLPRPIRLYYWGQPDPSFWFYLDGEMRHVTEMEDFEPGTPAFFLVAERDLDQEPDLVHRLEILEVEEAADGKRGGVLGRLRFPPEGIRLFSALGTSTARLNRRAPTAVASRTADASSSRSWGERLRFQR